MSKSIFSDNLLIKYSTIILLCIAGISLSVYSLVPAILGGIVGIICTFIFGFIISYLISNLKYFKSIPVSLCFSSLTTAISLILINSLIYFIYKITPTTVTLSFVLLAFVVIFLSRQIKIKPLEFCKLKLTFRTSHIIAIIILFCQGLMIYKLFLKTTTEALASPWLLFGNNFFIIYILTLVLLFIFQYQTKKNPLAFVFLIIHYFITFGVVAIIYKLGYGYDPFLHRAAESHILEFGAILPKTPFYLGQYITVVLTNLISHLPLKLIDIWLVPILSAITLPFSAYFGSKYGLKLKDNWARITALLTLLYPLNTMYVTTPHNLANLLLLNLILISPAIYQNRSLIVPSTILGIFAFIAQPLSGFFALWLLAGIVILDVAKKKSTALIYIYTIAGIMAIPFLFLIYWSLNKISIPTLSTISNNINNFPDLFLLAPYYFINQQVSWILDFVYLSRIFIPILIVAVSIFAFYKLKENKFKIYFLLPIIILGNIFFISTWLIHPDLDPKEQLQYAERLRHILIFFIIPFSSFGIIYLLKKIRKKTILIFSFIFISLILTATWYLTYPQRNPKVHFPGLNVTQADFDASKLIHDENTDSNYIVLSTILTSAASIEQFGFTTYFDTNLGQFFYYSIPSGSPLYQAYLKMLYEEQSQETMQEVMDLTKTDKAYFVINSYWHDFANIVEGAKKTADSWQEVDGGNIWVFRYGTLYPERSETE